jgi:histidinol-phosphate/aromatic aminotransferase/cobyric acid decarboxylase-like protein/choline kinase
MQAIILAAGMGKRLGEYTQNNTKCMVPVNGIRLIDRVIPQLVVLHLNRIIIVIGYKGKELKSYLGNKYDNLVKIEYIDNPVFDKTNNIYSLSLAKTQMEEDDTILVESDLIFEDSLFTMIANDPNPNVALVAKYESWMDGTMVRIDEDNNIINFVPKKAFNYSDIDLYFKTVNIYKFSKEFSKNKYVPFLDAYCKALGNNEYYEQVLRVITLLDGSDLKALPVGNKKWYEIDDVQDLDIAETIFADDDSKLKKIGARYGGYWRFPGLLDFCYLVNPYFPTGKMKEEMKSNFDALLTEYPSGMSVNSLLASKYFGIKRDYVVVGNGAAELIKVLMENLSGGIGVIFPTFEEYPNRSNQDSIIPYVANNKDYRYSADDLIGYFQNQDITSLLLINPDNPSGNFIPISDVLRLAAWCKGRNVKFFVDESFVDFTNGFENNSLLHNNILESNHNLVVVKSISKSYGVPGIRLGVMASSDIDLISKIKKDVSIWNINSFAEFYMQIFGKYSSDYVTSCGHFVKERNRFFTKLSEIKYLHVIPSQANYFLCEIIDTYSSSELAKILLLKYNILIKDCNAKKSLEKKNYVRVAIRNSNDNDMLINALKSLEQ